MNVAEGLNSEAGVFSLGVSSSGHLWGFWVFWGSVCVSVVVYSSDGP